MSPTSQDSPPVFGLDAVLTRPELLEGERLGLLTNFAAVTAQLERGVDALLAAGIPLTCLISPEHGYWGAGQAGSGEEVSHDPRTALPVLDSYALHGQGLDELLAGAGIDRLLVDLQDIGCRFYTYMWSMVEAMEACTRLGLPVTVLDRPSPVAASALGPGLDPACASFVGRLPVPLRHGMRLGQLARAVAAEHLGGAVDLQVIEAPAADGAAPWVAPSPNMPTREIVALYPGTGLLEGTTLSEGRGTTQPFALFGAPWDDGRLAAALREQQLPGVRIREAVFTPTHGKHAGASVHGAQVHLTARGPLDDPQTFDPLRIGHAILAAAARLHPTRPLWRESAADGREFIDLLWGSSALREGIEDGASYEEILASSPAPQLGARSPCEIGLTGSAAAKSAETIPTTEGGAR